MSGESPPGAPAAGAASDGAVSPVRPPLPAAPPTADQAVALPSASARGGGLVELRRTRTARTWRPPRWLRRLSGPVLLVAVWYAASATGVLSPSTLASPADVLRQGWDLIKDGQLPQSALISGRRVLLGFLAGTAIGGGLALVSGFSRLGEDLIDLTVGMIRTVPWAGLIPLFIIWFGIDEAPKVALVALSVAIPIYLNLYGAVRAVDSQLVEAGRTLGLGRLGLIRHVVLPGALPGALVGLRYALGSAWLALVFAESINATAGIGYLMNNAGEFFQTDVIVVCLATYAILGLLCDLAVRTLSRHLLDWRASFVGE